MTAPLANDRLKALIETLRDGQITPDEHRDLEQLLRQDADTRRYYVEYQLLCADLQAILPSRDAGEFAAGLAVAKLAARGAAPRAAWIGTAVAALLVLGLGALWMSGRLDTRRAVPARSDSAVATLIGAMDAEWKTDVALTVGSPLTAMPLELSRGLAEIRFRSGASVILQAPVECVLESPSHLTLRSGRVSAKVPVEAIGFTVRTSQATVVDLGTEFGVSSEAQGATDVHVFRGQVALGTQFGPKPDRQLLGEGVAKRVEVGGSRIETIRSDELAFVLPREFEARVKAMHNSPYHRWLASSYHLRREPSLVLYYTWDSAVDNPQRVVNRAGATAGKLDGLLGNGDDPNTCPQWVSPGRWPEQRALRFDGSRRQLLRVPHSNELNITQSLTLAAWIRPNTALLPPTAVIAAKRIASGNTQANYELALLREQDRRGDVRYGLCFRSGSRRVTSAGLPVVPGQWMHVAVTANGRESVLYVDGQRVATGSGAEFIANEGDLWIGSTPHGTQAGAQGDESFEGLISEFVLVRRAMADKDIRELWSIGHPEP